MTEEIVSTVVGKIVEKAVDLTVGAVGRQCGYVFCYKRNIQTLRSQLNKLTARRDGVQLSTDEAAWNLGTTDPSVMECLQSADDIKSHAKEVLDGTSNVEKGCLYGWCPNLKRRYLLSRKAQKLTAHIFELLKDGGGMAVKSSHPAAPVGIVPPVLASSISPKVDGHEEGFATRAAPVRIIHPVLGSSISPKVDGHEEGFASRIAYMNDVMDALKDDRIFLIGISGMGGVGKTTLMNQVIKKVKATYLFKEVAMAVVSQKSDLVKIQNEIAEQLGLKLDERSSVAREERLCERLKRGGRVLVVLDDIWQEIDLGEVGIPIGNGCKVVFITRNEHVCVEMKVQRHIKVMVLSDQEAWSLFREAAGDCVENVDLRDIAKEVAKECGGLPIAVVTLGKALSQREKCKWEDTLLRLRNSSGLETKVESSIMMSYDFLESCHPNPQPLLLLCSLFEEDANIQIEQLVQYSMGLDLFGDVETLEDTRNRVHSLLNDLKNCNLLLQGVGGFDNYYANVSVKLHDVVRDVCMSIASGPPHAYMVKHAEKLKQWPICNGHKADHTAITLKSGAMYKLPGGRDYPNLRLLQLQLECKKVTIAEDFFQGMRRLQVFKFVGWRYEKICAERCSVLLPPLVLQHLTNLQTLSLEFCNIGGDLSSIGYAKGLKILSFYESQLDELPSEVGELENLKLLDLRLANDLRIEASVLSGLDQLEVLYLGNCLFPDVRLGNDLHTEGLNSLSCLTTLQIRLSSSMILLELEESFLNMLTRFDIYIGSFYENFSWGEHGIIRNTITLECKDLSWVSHTKLRFLVPRIQYLSLFELDKERFMLDERESGFSPLSNLESVVIHKMKNLREISPDGKLLVGSFHQVQELNLSHLPALKYLWRGTAQPPSLSNLRYLWIRDCESMESLFSPNVAKCMVQLQDLRIHMCERLKGVVRNQGKEDDDNGFENIQFPKLKSIILEDLRDFKSLLYTESSSEDLEVTIPSLFNQWVTFPSLEEIDLINVGSIEQIVGYQMQFGPAKKNLQKISVSKCKDLKSIVGSTTLENLEQVEIFDCDSLKAVFDLEGLKVGGELDSPFVFDKLASIKLDRVQSLSHVWRMVPDGIQGFRNVTTLELVSCNKIRYLLSYSVAKMLVNLQFLKVNNCTEIVG